VGDLVTTSFHYVRVYRPVEVYEYEIEVDEDLIGLEDESDACVTPSISALREALRRAKAGENREEISAEEFVALDWDEANVMHTAVLLGGFEAKLREIEKVLSESKGMEEGAKARILALLAEIGGWR